LDKFPMWTDARSGEDQRAGCAGGAMWTHSAQGWGAPAVLRRRRGRPRGLARRRGHTRWSRRRDRTCAPARRINAAV